MTAEALPRVSRRSSLVLALLFGLLVWTRLVGLSASLWNDEAYSAAYYIAPGPGEILAGDYVPNDHVLFNLLTWATTRVLGTSEPTLRLWSVLPALAAAWLVTIFALRHLGVVAALCFAFLVTTSPVHRDLAMQARGYGLGFLAAALVLIGAIAAEAGKARRAFGLLAFGGFVGVATLPVFVLPFGAHVLLLVRRRATRLPALLAIAAVGVLCLVLYSRIWKAILASSGQAFGDPVSWFSLIAGPGNDLVRPSLEVLVPGFPARAVKWLVVPALIGGFAVLRSRGRPEIARHLLWPVVATYLGMRVLGVYYVPRFVSFLLFDVLALCAVAMAALGAAASRSAYRRWWLFAVGLGFAVGSVRFYRFADAQAALPMEAYREVAAIVRNAAVREIWTDSAYGSGFAYYLGEDVAKHAGAAELEKILCEGDAPFAFVHVPYYSTAFDPACLERRGAVRIQVPQREAGGLMQVWLVSAAAR